MLFRSGGDSNTTGMLHALLQQGVGRKFPGQVALGLMYDSEAARKACEAGVGATLELSLGTSVPTFTGQHSDPPVTGRFKVMAVSDGEDHDQETGLPHAAHAICCLMFLLWMMQHRPDLDDRWRPEPKLPPADTAALDQMEADIRAMAARLSPELRTDDQ